MKRLVAYTFATSVLAGSLFAADAPPVPAPKVVDTPEAAVRRMFHALSVGDKQDFADSILPFPGSDTFLDDMNAGNRKEYEETPSKPMRILKTDETIHLKNGSTWSPGKDHIGPDKAVVLLDESAAYFVIRTEKGWRVDLLSTLTFAIPLIGEWSFDEVARVTSPSGKLDAVLVETNGGATTSLGYEIYVLPKGEKAVKGNDVASLYAACRNKSAYGANLRWKKDSLVIEYLTARQEEKKSDTVTVAGEKVRILLEAGVEDPSAPGGGMLHKLEKPKQP